MDYLDRLEHQYELTEENDSIIVRSHFHLHPVQSVIWDEMSKNKTFMYLGGSGKPVFVDLSKNQETDIY